MLKKNIVTKCSRCAQWAYPKGVYILTGRPLCGACLDNEASVGLPVASL